MSKCIIHPKKPNKAGYVREYRNGVVQGAHRWAWIDTYGPIPKGLFVCHKCDVRNCVNPEHLFLGTTQDNTRDKVAKGRQSHAGPNNPATGDRNGARKYGLNKRESNPNSKLSESDISDIRQKYSTGRFSQQSLANEYNVVQPHISRIIHNVQWKKEE